MKYNHLHIPVDMKITNWKMDGNDIRLSLHKQYVVRSTCFAEIRNPIRIPCVPTAKTVDQGKGKHLSYTVFCLYVN